MGVLIKQKKSMVFKNKKILVFNEIKKIQVKPKHVFV